MKKVIAKIICGENGGYDIILDGDAYGLDYSIYAVGDTLAAAKTNFDECYRDTRISSEDNNLPFEEVDVTYSYDIPAFLRYYAYALTLAGLSRITGINQGQLSHYINGTSRPTARTIDKIQEAISNFGSELADVKFAV